MMSPLIARNVSSTPAQLGGEADRPGGVERLRLDGVAQLDGAAPAAGKGVAERVREEAEGQRHRGDVAALRGGGRGG